MKRGSLCHTSVFFDCVVRDNKKRCKNGIKENHLHGCHLSLGALDLIGIHRVVHSFFISLFFCVFAFRKSDVDAEPEESPGSSSSSTSSSRGAIDALSTGAAPAHASAGGAVQRGDGNTSDSDSTLDSSTGEEEEEEEDDPAMFSSKFLSGANPLSAVSSAVNKFGLFGDDGEGDKKAPPQQAKKLSGEQQPGGGPGKDSQQQQSSQKPGQGPSMQKSQPASKQGSPQLRGDEQAGPKSKPVGQAQSSNTGTEQPKAPPQQGSPKPGGQQQATAKSGIQAESPKVSPKPNMQQKAGVQQKDSTKTGAQGATKVGAEVGKQQQTSSKVGPQKEGIKQQPSDKQQEVKRAGTPDLKSAGAATKARSQSKTQPLCPVCKTTELNVHSKEPPNHRTCTQCKSEVCSLCGFSPPDSDVSKAPLINNILQLLN